MRIKLSLLMTVASIVLGGAILAMAIFALPLLSQYAAFLSILLLIFILGIIFAKFEESKISSKEVALIGILGAIIAASRIPFAALPNIMPCTFLIIVTGLVFGTLAGAMVGSMTAAVSNMFFGQGPWTPWMMVSWAMVGIVSGYVGKKYPNFGVRDIILLGIVLGMAYTEVMDLSSWLVFYRAEPDYFIPTFVAGLPFGALHIIGNVIFAVVLGKPVLALFKRFQKRFHVTYDSDKVPKAAGPTDSATTLR